MDHETVLAYLDRMGVTASMAGDAAGLRTLHRAHQMTVPFENLSIHLAEPISLEERDLVDKIVRHRRGGFCYELKARERSLADCVPTCWWQQTSPLSHFTQSTICSRPTPGGRVSISGRMLIQTQDGTRTEQQLETDEALPGLAPRITVPVHNALAEFDALWDSTPANVEHFAKLLTAAPFVDASIARATGHSIDHHILGHALHLRQLAFAEECQLWASQPS